MMNREIMLLSQINDMVEIGDIQGIISALEELRCIYNNLGLKGKERFYNLIKENFTESLHSACEDLHDTLFKARFVLPMGNS